MRMPEDTSVPALALLTAYYDFNKSPWTAANTAYCLRRWRAAGAYVILVEIALDAPSSATTDATKRGYTFAPTDGATNTSAATSHTDGSAAPPVADVIVGCRVRDAMWYKEAALNLGLAHVPPECALVGWFDNDVVFAPASAASAASAASTVDAADASWWVDALVHTFAQNPFVTFVQPFGELALTTERVRDELLGVRRAPLVESDSSTVDVDVDVDADADADADANADADAVADASASASASAGASPDASSDARPVANADATVRCQRSAAQGDA